MDVERDGGEYYISFQHALALQWKDECYRPVGVEVNGETYYP